MEVNLIVHRAFMQIEKSLTKYNNHVKIMRKIILLKKLP